MKRVYHPYHKWEEYHEGMWRSVSGKERETFLQEAITFTGDHELYGDFMLQVIQDWPYSCEHNLTCMSINRKAWIGRAACCIGINCPEDIVREAWAYLTQEQQDKANAKADEAIKKWETEYAKDTAR
jgi:hypothetical protein